MHCMSRPRPTKTTATRSHERLEVMAHSVLPRGLRSSRDVVARCVYWDRLGWLWRSWERAHGQHDQRNQ